MLRCWSADVHSSRSAARLPAPAAHSSSLEHVTKHREHTKTTSPPITKRRATSRIILLHGEEAMLRAYHRRFNADFRWRSAQRGTSLVFPLISPTRRILGAIQALALESETCQGLCWLQARGESGTGFYRFLCLRFCRSRTVAGGPRCSPAPR
jgi:hypothetical protein